MSRLWHDIGRAYERHVVGPGKEEAFWILIAFLVTFLVVRAITHMIRRGRGPFRNLSIGGTHLHHLVPGIILLIVTGYLANALHFRIGRTLVAVFFGIGAALTLDEFALWLNLKDVYWSKQGRRSIDAIMTAAALGSLVVIGFGFWRDVGRAFGRMI